MKVADSVSERFRFAPFDGTRALSLLVVAVSLLCENAELASLDHNEEVELACVILPRNVICELRLVERLNLHTANSIPFDNAKVAR